MAQPRKTSIGIRAELKNFQLQAKSPQHGSSSTRWLQPNSHRYSRATSPCSPPTGEGQLVVPNHCCVRQPGTKPGCRTFQRLDAASQTANWSNHRGTSVVNQIGGQANLIVSGSLKSLLTTESLALMGMKLRNSRQSRVNLLKRLKLLLTALKDLLLAKKLKLFFHFWNKQI